MESLLIVVIAVLLVIAVVFVLRPKERNHQR